MTEVKSDYQVRDRITAQDIIEHIVRFGPLYRLEELQKTFAPPENAMIGGLDTVVDVESIEFDSVGTNYATDQPDAAWSGTITSTMVQIDTGAAPTNNYELRKTDAAWGTASTLNSIHSF